MFDRSKLTKLPTLAPTPDHLSNGCFQVIWPSKAAAATKTQLCLSQREAEAILQLDWDDIDFDLAECVKIEGPYCWDAEADAWSYETIGIHGLFD